ncbi:hypothetical protein [Spartinivicinus poritis]|uniref:Uncharacterized protein n=1 Tax=Spartinivicinus poritis TaxID=2994640 RepID=A0ABT5U4K1_9GAMM|nr:hypothetical protein [Spartinivicinus sp. A2-2]MDE1461286.1 hypothetical protein [Spartinivicinus sp. A2-2]
MTHLASKKEPSFIIATLPIAITLLLMCCQILYFGDFTPHIPLIIGIIVTGMTGKYLGISWLRLESAIVKVVKAGLPSIYKMATQLKPASWLSINY